MATEYFTEGCWSITYWWTLKLFPVFDNYKRGWGYFCRRFLREYVYLTVLSILHPLALPWQSSGWDSALPMQGQETGSHFLQVLLWQECLQLDFNIDTQEQSTSNNHSVWQTQQMISFTELRSFGEQDFCRRRAMVEKEKFQRLVQG